MSELDLDVHLAGIGAGDRVAFAAWLAGAEPRLRASLASFASSVDVEAVLQESLLRLWQVAPKFVSDGAPNALLRFGIRVARNQAISEMRRRQVRPQVIESAIEKAAEQPSEPLEPDPLLRRVIAACREKLPKKPAAALSARIGAHGRADRDLAATLGMKLNTFLQNFGRARRLLAECLERQGVDLKRELAR